MLYLLLEGKIWVEPLHKGGFCVIDELLISNLKKLFLDPSVVTTGRYDLGNGLYCNWYAGRYLNQGVFTIILYPHNHVKFLLVESSS